VSDDEGGGENDPDGSDPWPHEPDDPGEGNPHDIGPSVDVPEPDVPSAPDDSSTDVPPELAHAFWTTVALVKVGMLAVAVGTMFVVFLDDLRRGGGLVVVGLAAFALAYRRYRGYRDREPDDGDDGGATRPAADGGRNGPE